MALQKEILDMCFLVSIFTVSQKGMFKKYILSMNKQTYRTEVILILESDRITKEEMVNLACRSTHSMKAHSVRVSENDNLYALYAQQIGQDVSFL